jgi:hypothetical protein
MPGRIVALGLLRSLYNDREKCIMVENMGGFSLSDSHFLRWEDHVIDFFRENARREVVGRAFSFGTVESWSHGCARPPSPGVEARKVDARGWSVGQAPIVSEGGAGCWW